MRLCRSPSHIAKRHFGGQGVAVRDHRFLSAARVRWADLGQGAARCCCRTLSPSHMSISRQRTPLRRQWRYISTEEVPGDTPWKLWMSRPDAAAGPRSSAHSTEELVASEVGVVGRGDEVVAQGLPHVHVDVAVWRAHGVHFLGANKVHKPSKSHLAQIRG
jgi:hypothetical protein